MPDPRIAKLAKVLIQYSLDLQPEEKFRLQTSPLAVGACYPETGSKNDAGIHWDMLCDMKDSAVRVDEDVFIKSVNLILSRPDD